MAHSTQNNQQFKDVHIRHTISTQVHPINISHTISTPIRYSIPIKNNIIQQNKQNYGIYSIILSVLTVIGIIIVLFGM